MIIAVTANDETNLAVTLIAEQLFNVPSRIARVRNDELREYPALLSTSGFVPLRLFGRRKQLLTTLFS